MIFTATLLVWIFIGCEPAVWAYLTAQSLVWAYGLFKDWS